MLFFRMKRPSPQVLVLSFSPLFRIAFGLFTAFFAAGSVAFGASPASVIIVAVSLLSSLYDETWRFDAESRTVTYRWGLLVIAKRKTWAYADVSSISVKTVAKGTRKETAKLVLSTVAGESLTIEMGTKSRKERLGTMAAEVAKALGLELSED